MLLSVMLMKSLCSFTKVSKTLLFLYAAGVKNSLSATNSSRDFKGESIYKCKCAVEAK